jgi:hypothetical protein
VSREGHSDDRGELLLIGTRKKVIARRVFAAAPLSPALAQGAAELATHDAATVWVCRTLCIAARRTILGPRQR